MRRVIDTITYVGLLIYTVAATLVSLHRFWQYEVFYYDFGIFDQAIWNVAHFKPPIVDHFVIGGKWIFADHFSPSIFLLSPLYWFTDKPEILLIAQAACVGLSGFVLYRIGRSLGNQPYVSAVVTALYMLFIGTQNAIISDIHEVTFMMLPLMLCFYSIIHAHKRLFWLTFLITLGFKESSSLLGVGIALFMYVWNPKLRSIAILSAVISLAWGYLTTQIIIPAFYGRKYFYTPSLSSDPLILLGSFFDSPEKRYTLFISFLSFGFLPLLSPITWPLILQDFSTRFLQHEFALRHTLGLHYSTQLAVLFGVSSLLGLRVVSSRIKSNVFLVMLSIGLLSLSLFLHQFKLHGPLGLSYNPAFYRHTNNFTFLNDLLSRVPKGSTVMTQNNLAPHLIHTHHVYLLRAVYDDYLPDYIVLDLREGQNYNDFFGANIEALKLTLPNDTRYEVFYKNGDQIIYRRKRYSR